MSVHNVEYDVFISYEKADKSWAEEYLAGRLNEQGLRVKTPRPGTAPYQHWEDWAKGEETKYRKFLFVFSPYYRNDDRVIDRIEQFYQQHFNRLGAERPVIPILCGGVSLPAPWESMLPLDFSNPDDFELRLRQLIEALDWPGWSLPDATPGRHPISMAIRAFTRWIGLKGMDASFEDAVAEVYRLLGFGIKRQQTFNGLPPGMLIERKVGGIATRTVIECSEKLPAGAHLMEIAQRRNLLKEREPELNYLLVSSHPLDQQSKTDLVQAGLVHITFPELLREIAPLDEYAEKLIAEYEQRRAKQWKGEDWFIRPDVRTEERPERHPAMIAIQEWLAGKRGNLFALLGDLGTGKTMLSRFLAYEMAKAYLQDPSRHPAPVLIDLKDVRKETSLESIVITHFSRQLKTDGVSYSRFEYLLKHGRIILLFDAFDEMAEHVSPVVMERNLRELLKPVELGGKVFLTCRTHYFKDLLEEEKFVGKGAVYLQEFTDEQVQRYLAKARPTTARDDWEIIQGVYNLKELALRPLLLEMVVETMPELPRVNSAALYARYAKQWVDREREKRRPLNPQVKLSLMKELAWKIWDDEAQVIQADYLLRLVGNLRRAQQLDFHGLEDNEVAEEIRTASFLKRDERGNCTFADPSFCEYFLACKLHDGLTRPDLSTTAADLLRTRLFDRKVILFLTQMIKEDASFQLLRNILTQTYEALVSENALQILYWSGRIQMGMEESIHDPDALRSRFGTHLPRGAKLSKAKLRGITLEAADLREADFGGADLTGTDFTHADLRGATFRGAILTGATIERVQAASTNFREAELSGAIIRHGNFRDADFTGSIHRQAVIEENETAETRGLSDSSEPMREDLLPTVQTFSPGLHSMAIAPSGEWYASGHQDGLITIHRLLDDRLLLTLEGHRYFPDSLHFSLSGAMLISGGRDKTSRLWSVSDGRLLQQQAQGDYVRTARFSPDGVLAASGGDDGNVYLWQVDGGKTLRLFGGFEGHAGKVNAVDFSSDGKLLASASSDGTVRVWDVDSGQVRYIFTLEDDSFAPRKLSVSAAQFSPNGKLLAAAGADFRIRVWSAVDGKQVCIFKGHTEEVTCLSFSSDGKWLFSGGKDRILRGWSIHSARLQFVSEEHSDFIDTVWVSADDKQLMSGSTDRRIHRWSLTGEQALTVPLIPADPQLLRVALKSARLSADGRWAAAGGDDGRVYVWTANECGIHLMLEGHKAPIRSVDFSPDSLRLASGSEDGVIRIWMTASGQPTQTIKAHHEKMTAVQFSPKGTAIVSASEDRSLKLWLAENGELLNTIRLPKTGINAVCFSPDGQLLAAGCEDKNVLLWSQSPHQIRRLEGHAAGVNAVQFSPDGVWLASGGKDGKVRLWRVATGQPRYWLEGHLDRISALQFSPTGAFLASGSLDGSVRIWNVETGKIARVLTGHLGEVYGVAFTQNGNCLIAAGAAGRLQYWDIETGQTSLYRYALAPGAWIDILPDGRFHASDEGKRHLCYTEKGTLHSHPGETMMAAFYQPQTIESVLRGLVGPAEY